MTWKAYAAVSGATVLAGWFASAPPAGMPARGVPDASAAAPGQMAAGGAMPAPDIEREAARLEARVRREAAYAQPQRNPFRFGATRPSASVGADPAETSLAETGVPAAVPSSPPPLPVSLAGIAEDQVEQRVERMAILSSPDGVLLVREGEDVLGQYQVAKIDSDAVELVRYADGVTVRLGFAP